MIATVTSKASHNYVTNIALKMMAAAGVESRRDFVMVHESA